MYSTEFGELAHKTQIKAGWRQSNKNDASRQIVQSYSRQHGTRMRLLNLESLRRCGADLSPTWWNSWTQLAPQQRLAFVGGC